MTRCLSDRALTRVLTELGTRDERAHLAACASCATRFGRLQGEMAEIVEVLSGTPEPRLRVMPGAGRWVATAAALAAVAVAALFWIETGSRTRVRPASDETRQVAVALADISSALFSVDGEPDRPGASLEPDEAFEGGCETATQLDRIDCGDGALALGEETGALDLEINGGPAWRGEDRDEGD